VALVKVEDCWWWCSGRIDNIPEVGFGYFGMLGLDNAEGRMGSVASGMESTVLCG
jgi:hypothetical protein